VHKKARRTKTQKLMKKTPPHRVEEDVLDSALRDSFPASDAISMIEPATKDDPTTVTEPSKQTEPPRAPGP